MKEISVNCDDLCRICLSVGVHQINIFHFSDEMESQLSDLIMNCAPVQIRKNDLMPKFLCELCYSQLEKMHKFQKQIVQSDKTLQCYLEQLQTSDIQTKSEYCNEKPSEDYLISTTGSDADITVKREPLEQHDAFDVTDELKETAPDNYCAANKIETEIFLKSEIETLDENLLYPDETVETLSKDDSNDISFEDKDTNIGLGHFLTCEIKDEKPLNEKSSSHTTEPPIDNFSLSSHLPYQCDICKKCYSKLNSLNYHKRTHTGEKPYQCNICNKSFPVSSSLIVHKRIHTGEKPYQCDICDKRFSQLAHINIHKRSHAGEKPYQCDICNKHFGMLHSLNIHKRTHTGEKPYQCDICNKYFSLSDTLNKHKRTHTGEKPYQCDVCNKWFSQLGSLNVHKRTHTGEKPFFCDVCNKCFSRLNTLNKHKVTHTGEKPYQCNMCNKCFNQLSSLNRHKRSHTGEETISEEDVL